MTDGAVAIIVSVIYGMLVGSLATFALMLVLR